MWAGRAEFRKIFPGKSLFGLFAIAHIKQYNAMVRNMEVIFCTGNISFTNKLCCKTSGKSWSAPRLSPATMTVTIPKSHPRLSLVHPLVHSLMYCRERRLRTRQTAWLQYYHDIAMKTQNTLKYYDITMIFFKKFDKYTFCDKKQRTASAFSTIHNKSNENSSII